MAASNLNMQKASGGILNIQPVDGVTNTSVTIPESGNLVSVSTAVTDNAIARYDGATGKLQDSGVIIDDNGNVGIGVTPSAWYPGNIALETGKYSALYQGQGGEQNLESNSYRNGFYSWVYKSSGNGASRYVNDFGLCKWYTAPSGIAGNPITWTNAMILDNSGNLLLLSGTGGLGYGTGAGGIVTQLTSKSTDVTLNKPCGIIITSNSTLASGSTVSFIVYNNLVTSADLIYCYGGSYSSSYQIAVDNTTYENGKFNIRITNNTGMSLSNSVLINFSIIKGANS